jgi:hypothetical protein
MSIDLRVKHVSKYGLNQIQFFLYCKSGNFGAWKLWPWRKDVLFTPLL